ncbi:hypothetical protein BDN72DRAFT_830303 [Pluteus cervinus]|uniref:Uncharacterized protein n=1 Tax=Pluteus cervinus TaxID=181527 RepID=A0ACD3BH37_9AGAR|nr:hypothetical protein BDN72DRAFT_830303 [Pluteus cervinus]
MARNPYSNVTVLDYFRPSPVRGQLEPWDPSTAAGWRYLQTTDTLDEFKVLLPPGTANMYEQLLKLEGLELAKKSAISWQRLLEIRHLKDRMIRKCQKLPASVAQRKMVRNGTFGFSTIVAPPDFRVKEMEKWFRNQQKNVMQKRPTPQTQSIRGTAQCCSRCAAAEQKRMLEKQSTSKNAHSVKPKALPTPTNTKALPPPTSPKTTTAPAIETSRSPKGPTTPLQIELPARPVSPGINILASPPPLRYPFRPQYPNNELPLASDSTLGEEPHGETDKLADIPRIPRRRRSCIKRNSIGDLAKTVSWADDRNLDQARVLQDAQTSKLKWEEVRDVYTKQMTGLDTLQNQVTDNLSQLRIEVEQLEKLDSTLRQQRETIRQTFKDLEQNQESLQTKVREAIEADDRVATVTALNNLTQPH